MSRLWPERILVSLEPARLAWARRGTRGSATADPGYGSEPWHGAIEALRAQADQWRTLRARVHVVLSNAFARYLLVPPGGGAAPAEREALARFHFARVHGERAQDWATRLSAAPRGPQVACAVDRALLEALAGCFGAGSRARLASVQPYLVSAYNRWRRRIPREGAWLVLAEPAGVCVAALGARGWRAVAAGRGPDWRGLLERERLRMAGGAAPGTMLLHAGGLGDLLPLGDAPGPERLAA